MIGGGLLSYAGLPPTPFPVDTVLVEGDAEVFLTDANFPEGNYD